MAKKLPYTNGDFVAVPLHDDGGYAVGLIVAHDGRGIVIGYFFGMRYEQVPPLAVLGGLGVSDAFRGMRFGDLGLLRSEWPVLGQHPNWCADDWPMPWFGRRGTAEKSFKVMYSAGELARPTVEEVITAGECNGLPRDALSGSVAVERVLAYHLPRNASPAPPNNDSMNS